MTRCRGVDGRKNKETFIPMYMSLHVKNQPLYCQPKIQQRLRRQVNSIVSIFISYVYVLPAIGPL